MTAPVDPSTLPASERARIVGERIREAVARGELRLEHGGYLYEDVRQPDVCMGCAIGAAARVLGNLRECNSSKACRAAVCGSGLVTEQEAIELECGFEGWHGMYPEPANLSVEMTEADTSSPFYLLGAALRAEARL